MDSGGQIISSERKTYFGIYTASDKYIEQIGRGLFAANIGK